MRPIDIRALVESILAVIFLAIALGQFGKLQKFAREEAVHALESRGRLQQFFPKDFEVPRR